MITARVTPQPALAVLFPTSVMMVFQPRVPSFYHEHVRIAILLWQELAWSCGLLQPRLETAGCRHMHQTLRNAAGGHLQGNMAQWRACRNIASALLGFDLP